MRFFLYHLCFLIVLQLTQISKQIKGGTCWRTVTASSEILSKIESLVNMLIVD